MLPVRNNHSRPISFTACHALLVTRWTPKTQKSHTCFQQTSTRGLGSRKLFKVALVRFIPNRLKQIATYLEGCGPHSPLVLCPGPPVLFCLGTGGCQSGFMSSSLELKEVSFMSCYGTRRPCLSGVMRSFLGEPGERGPGPSPGGDQQ